MNPSFTRTMKFNSTSGSVPVTSLKLCGIDAAVKGWASQGCVDTPGAVTKKCWPARQDERRFFDRRMEILIVSVEIRSIEDTGFSVLASLDGLERRLIQMTRENRRQRSNAQITKPGKTCAVTKGICMMTPIMKMLTKHHMRRCHFVHAGAETRRAYHMKMTWLMRKTSYARLRIGRNENTNARDREIIAVNPHLMLGSP